LTNEAPPKGANIAFLKNMEKMKMENSGNANELEKREELKKEIIEKLSLYHQTSLEKWKKIQAVGAILSERELISRGLITKEEAESLADEFTSTGQGDREVGRDDFVFASTKPAGYGQVTLKIDLSALQISGAKVSTAGEWLMHYDEEDRDYFNETEIPANKFISYLVDFLPTLPNKNWFWGDRNGLQEFFGEAMLNKIHKNDKIKFRTFWKLYPEIIFPKELPLKYIKQVIINEAEEA